MDKKIVANYKLWPNNYIAYDMLNGTSEYVDKYTAQEKEIFVAYMGSKLDKLDVDKQELEQIFLEIYANPVVSVRNL